MNTADVLEKVISMPISTWSYTTETNGTRHMGPMAQDFYSAFGLGDDERRITSIDADGVAFAAIQGLAGELEEKSAKLEENTAELEEKDDRIAELEQANETLREQYASLEARIDDLEEMSAH